VVNWGGLSHPIHGSMSEKALPALPVPLHNDGDLQTLDKSSTIHFVSDLLCYTPVRMKTSPAAKKVER